VRSLPSNGRRRPSRRGHGRAAGAAAAALCACLLAGCGGSSKAAGSGPAGSAAPPTTESVPALPADQPQKAACGLITQAEVEAAVGAKVAAGKQDVQAARSTCSFALASATDQSVVLVSTSSSGVPAFFDAARQRTASPQAVTAGDSAFVAAGQGFVRRGTTMVAVVLVLRQPPAQLVAASTKLVQAVAVHL
jgi:uncharacterized protein DUF3558